MQKVKGEFDITFLGIPLLFVSKTTLKSENGSVAELYSLHLTPFIAVGFVRSRDRKANRDD